MNAIDREKLRVALRRMGQESLCYFLDDALDLLSPAQLRAVAKNHVDLKSVRPEPKTKGRNPLDEVQAFERASLAREFHESFNVNSKNYMEKSNGTRTWIAECRRLLDRCVASAKVVDPTDVREAFEIIFSLLDRLDSGDDEVIFFADEAGAWQVGVEWEKVLPAVPGDRNCNESTWRPRPDTSTGNAGTSSGSMVLPSCGWVVLRPMLDAVTSTVSVAAPVASGTSTVKMVLTSTVTAFCAAFLNPAASTTMSYLPGFKPLMA